MYYLTMKDKGKLGFSLIELLVAVIILGILAMVGLASFSSSQRKARDAVRKHDLTEVQKAIEMYSADHGVYPLLDLSWGNEFNDAPVHQETLYMKQLPKDPLSDQLYCYRTPDEGDSYQLYANLENTNDPAKIPTVSCGGRDYNFGVSSPNIDPEDINPEE